MSTSNLELQAVQANGKNTIIYMCGKVNKKIKQKTKKKGPLNYRTIGFPSMARRISSCVKVSYSTRALAKR